MSTPSRYRTSHSMDPAARQKYRLQYERRLAALSKVMSDEQGIRESWRRFAALPAPLEALQLEMYRWLS